MNIARVAIAGTGVIGAGWAARLVQNRLGVAVHDSAPDTEAKVRAMLREAGRSHARLTMAPPAPATGVLFASSLAEAVEGADLVIECGPDRLDLKRAVLAGIERAARPDALVACSTSAFLPSDLQAEMRHPERFFVAQPSEPVHLLPAVEVIGGARTAAGTIDAALRFFRRIGMMPVRLAGEAEGLVASRLQQAMRREAEELVRAGICTAADLDDVVRHGFGLRLAQMGPLGDHRPAGVAGAESDRARNDDLVAILQALRSTGRGAGAVLAEHEARLFDAASHGEAVPDLSGPVRTTERRVPSDWTDYNGHMNEARYLQAFADATDALMRMIGCDADYIASGWSYFTVETHIRHLDEVTANEPVFTETQVIAGAGRKLHLFHWLRHGDGRLLATGEHMLIHVSLRTRAASEPGAEVAAALARIAGAHAALRTPEGLGRAVAQPR